MRLWETEDVGVARVAVASSPSRIADRPIVAVASPQARADDRSRAPFDWNSKLRENEVFLSLDRDVNDATMNSRLDDWRTIVADCERTTALNDAFVVQSAKANYDRDKKETKKMKKSGGEAAVAQRESDEEKEKKQLMIFLVTVAERVPEVGYCQGMSGISSLLLYMGSGNKQVVGEAFVGLSFSFSFSFFAR